MRAAWSVLIFVFCLTPLSAVLAVEGSVKVEDAGLGQQTLELRSSGFTNGAAIPVKYTCRGSDFSPPLHIQGIPPGTRSMALTVHDPNGPVGVWSHWLVFNIEPNTVDIPENSIPGRQALNDFGNFYYGGPCPSDEREHRYVFTLYALNAYLADVTEGATLDTFQKELVGKVIAKTELVGTYENPKWLKE